MEGNIEQPKADEWLTGCGGDNHCMENPFTLSRIRSLRYVRADIYIMKPGLFISTRKIGNIWLRNGDNTGPKATETFQIKGKKSQQVFS